MTITNKVIDFIFPRKEPQGKWTLIKQGAPRVCDVRILERTRNLILLDINMDSKRDHWTIIRGRTVGIYAGRDTMFIDESYGREEPTDIRIDFIPRSFRIEMERFGKYTITLLFRRSHFDKDKDEDGFDD